MSLDERIVVVTVTGGAMGIGQAIADGFNGNGNGVRSRIVA